MDRVLFVGQNGQVCCPDHVGHYGQVILRDYPDACVLDTPLGEWVRMSFVEVDEWVAYMGERGRDACEVCASRLVAR
jgi:hypothetical protein